MRPTLVNAGEARESSTASVVTQHTAGILLSGDSTLGRKSKPFVPQSPPSRGACLPQYPVSLPSLPVSDAILHLITPNYFTLKIESQIGKDLRVLWKIAAAPEGVPRST